MTKQYKYENHLCDIKNSSNKDVRKVQKFLRAGGSIVTVYKDMGFDYEYAGQIIRYLEYREWRYVCEEEMLEFEEWKDMEELA